VHTAPHAGTPSGQGIQPAAYAFSIAPLLDFVEFRLHKILHQAYIYADGNLTLYEMLSMDKDGLLDPAADLTTISSYQYQKTD